MGIASKELKESFSSKRFHSQYHSTFSPCFVKCEGDGAPGRLSRLNCRLMCTFRLLYASKVLFKKESAPELLGTRLLGGPSVRINSESTRLFIASFDIVVAECVRCDTEASVVWHNIRRPI